MRRICGTVAIALIVGLAGCLTSQPLTQTPDEIERDKELEGVAVVGDITEVANAGPLQVSGVGLVTGLAGTGGTPRGEFRAMLEKDLRQRKIEDIGKLLESPNNALVLITAMIPAGGRKYEPLDLQISLPPGSPCTSLRGGYLQPCMLRNYETTKGLKPDYDGGNRLLQGHILAVGKGPLLVGFGNPGEPAELKKARVWEGGATLVERPYYFELKKEKDERTARVAHAVASRINMKFPDDAKKQEFVQQNRHLFLLEEVTAQLNGSLEANTSTGRGDVARAINTAIVNVRVPFAYRFNPERYLRVARLIPLQEDPQQHAAYRARLQKMLAEPKDTIRAALRLEALGVESVPAFRQALKSEHAWVRYAAAESLLYLGEPIGAEEVARAALEQPSLRAYALIALASLDEGICRTKLEELLNTNDAELRAGAFQALRLVYSQSVRSEQELDAAMARLGGENVGPFWLYRVAPNTQPSVDFAVTKRTEIVIFGSDVSLAAPVRVRAGEEYVVTVEVGDDRCFVSRISPGIERRTQAGLGIDEVLRALVDLGGSYTDAVDLLRNLEEQQGLTCPVRRLSPPEATPLQDLLAEARAAAQTE